MADELDPVVQKFIADVKDYIDGIQKAADSAEKLAKSTDKAKAATADLKAKVEEAARAIGIMRDEEGQLRNKQGEVITATEAQAAALSHLKEEALKAAFAEYDLQGHTGGLRDKVAEAAVAIGIMRDEEGKLRNSAGEVIGALEAESLALGHLRDKAAEAAFAERELGKYQEQRVGLLSRLGGGIGGGIGSGLDALGSGSGLMSLNGLLGGLAAAMAILPEIGALTTGLLAAGAGVAAFGAVAIPNLSAAATAAQKVQTAQDTYNVSIANGVKHATAYRAEQIAIGKAYAELSPQQVQLSQTMGALQNQWQSFVQANTGAVSSVLSKGIGIIGQLLPWLQQFVSVATPVIGQMLTGLSKFIESPNFQYFMTFLSQLSGPALLAIGSGMEGLTIRVMQLFETFSKKDVINAINIAFRLLGFAIELVQGIILEGMAAWDLLTQTVLPGVRKAFDETRHAIASFAHGVAVDFDGIRHNTAQLAHDVAHWFDDIRHGIAELAHDWAVWFDRIRHTIATWADNVVKFFQQLPGRIVHALGNLLNLLVQAGKDIIQGLLNGLQSAAGSVLNFIGNLASTISGAFTGFMGIRSPSTVFMRHGRDTLLGYIAGLQSVAPQVQAAMRAIGGQVAYGGLPGITGGYGGAVAGRPGLNVTVTIAPGAGSLADARWLQALQPVIQEAILRYNLNNPSNGLAIPGGRL